MGEGEGGVGGVWGGSTRHGRCGEEQVEVDTCTVPGEGGGVEVMSIEGGFKYGLSQCERYQREREREGGRERERKREREREEEFVIECLLYRMCSL